MSTNQSELSKQMMETMLQFYPEEHHQAIRDFANKLIAEIDSVTFKVNFGKATITMDLQGYVTDIKLHSFFRTKKVCQDLVKCYNDTWEELAKQRRFYYDNVSKKMVAFIDTLNIKSTYGSECGGCEKCDHPPTPEELN